MNKFKLIIIIGMFFSIISISKVYANIFNYNLLGKVIYLDPGHGGRDSGAIYKNIYEKDINLIISKKIEKYLTAKGATVYLTRESDIDLSTTTKNKKRSDLSNRAKLINESKADLYISIHLNYISNSRWKGLQIFYNNKNKENEIIANTITSYLKKTSNTIREPKKENIYYMYKQINTPGILIELGFLSNPNDRYRLTKEEYQDKLAISISNAIENYFINK
ncbi:MAG: N-acetylmuramoyl-L-alanine amidase [Bacilli bacterium]|nr:N-acetylmuramoyl-L-alanine amidase [Bacilli bacterium]